MSIKRITKPKKGFSIPKEVMVGHEGMTKEQERKRLQLVHKINDVRYSGNTKRFYL